MDFKFLLKDQLFLTLLLMLYKAPGPISKGLNETQKIRTSKDDALPLDIICKKIGEAKAPQPPSP